MSLPMESLYYLFYYNRCIVDITNYIRNNIPGDYHVLIALLAPFRHSDEKVMAHGMQGISIDVCRARDDRHRNHDIDAITMISLSTRDNIIRAELTSDRDDRENTKLRDRTMQLSSRRSP